MQIINIFSDHRGSDGWLFVEMEYLEGRDLERYIFEESEDGLGVDRTLALLKPIAEALDYAHSRPKPLIHRDLKPGNVFITKEDEIKLLDFDLAYQLRSSSSAVNIQEAGLSGTVE